jgi:spermidine dehydrogenase
MSKILELKEDFQMNRRDHVLGMDRPITRRDFINGVGIAVTGSLLSSSAKALGIPPSQSAGTYPPALTGLRGSHDGSWEIAHQMRDGQSWDDVRAEANTGEFYDLVVVGGGISGLAAAYFYRKQAGPNARVLVLDNHDDFGGHARRNEFYHGDRFMIGYGGTQSIDRPSGFSPEAMGLMRELGIDVDRFYTYFERDLYSSLHLGRGEFFDEETFGVDRLVVRENLPLKEYLSQTPLSPTAQKDLVRLEEETKDYMPGLTVAEKLDEMKKTSYRDFLIKYVKVDPQVLTYLQTRGLGLFGVGIDAIPSHNCWSMGYSGFQGMGLGESPFIGRMGRPPKPTEKPEPYIFHFPDGCATIPRLLVRALIPASTPGNTMEDIVTARVDYARLDEESSPVRIRLNSTVVRARHLGDPQKAKEVELTYLLRGKPQRVRGSACVLACWNTVVPYLCPEMPEEQKKALSYAVKVPLVYTNVLIDNWTSFQKLGISSVSCPGGYWSSVSLDFPVSIGEYKHPRSPKEPVILHLSRAPASPGLSPKEQFRVGRFELLDTPFELFEREIREQLNRILGPGGFDAARDIEAITVNRWPHGYAYEYQYMGEPDWPEGKMPCVVGRKPFGRISIANSDSAGEAYVDPAIDQAYRAVQEILQG